MSALMDAVKAGCLEDVKSVMSAEGVVDGHEISTEAFSLALNAGFKTISMHLLEHEHFDPNANDSEPLRLAIRLGYLDIAARLLEKGANPNVRCEESSSALVLALEYEYFELAEQMVACGAEVNIRNAKGWTPLIWAAIKGYRRIVEFLLEKGADIHICNDDGWNALTGAYFKQRSDIVDLLIERGAYFGRKYSEAALLSAYQQGYSEVVTKLVSEGCNVNIMDAEGTPLLILAIRRGDIETVKLLLAHGADANGKCAKGNAALSVALDVHDGIGELLIAVGANVHVANQNSWVPLHQAAYRSNAGLCRLLLEHGVNPDQKTDDGRTALMLAAKAGHLAVAKVLIEKGANLNLETGIGTARQIAQGYKQFALRDYLAERGAV